MLIIDAHEDLAWNILTFQRDYCKGIAETRLFEKGKIASKVNGETLLGWDEYKKGSIALIFSTLFVTPARYCMGSWDTEFYLNITQAKQKYQNQLDAYNNLCDANPDKFRLIKKKIDLDEILNAWRISQEYCPVGLVVLMEGAEAIGNMDELEGWWNQGVKIIGPAWSGTRFCGGTNEPGPLTKDGYQLLDAMEDFGFVLDVSHMDEESALQALDHYSGPVIASHSNIKKLVKGAGNNRHVSDKVLYELIERNGIIGVIPYNKFLDNSWKEGDSRFAVSLEHVVGHIDYICQVAGNANHAGIGSDFDGGFGLQSTPHEINSIADLQKIASLLTGKGYSDEDVELIMGKNWLGCVENALQE